jgi:Domain of unknown function (DUF4328)/Protein of unknown function (DUF2510)
VSTPQTPGWYADPWGTDDERYFDGGAWTRSVRPPGSRLTPEAALQLRDPFIARPAPMPEGVGTDAPAAGIATGGTAGSPKSSSAAAAGAVAAGASGATAAPPVVDSPNAGTSADRAGSASPVATPPPPAAPQSVPGWYADPWGSAPLRWWDGSQWSGYTSGAAADNASGHPIEVQVEGERGSARLARLSLLWAGPALALLVVADAFQAKWYAEHWSEIWSAASNNGTTPRYDNTGVQLLAQIASIGLLVAGVMFLMWFYRAASISSAAGIPARRRPVWAVVTFFIPFVNWWFPYQSACDLFPEGHPARKLVARWWALWIGVTIGGLLMLGAAFLSATLLAIVGIVTAAAAIPAAAAARDVVAESLALHESLAARATS